MKKLLAVLITLLVVAAVQAAAPAATVVDGNYDWDKQQDISASAGFDTLVAADSSSLLTKFVPKRGWEYIVVLDAITGTGSDSVSADVRIDCFDGSNNLLYRVSADSITAAVGEAIVLPFGQTAFGNKFDVKLKGYGADGTQAILNRIYLYRRRVVNGTYPTIITY